MDNIIENTLKNDFVEYTKVYEIAALHGMTKREVKKNTFNGTRIFRRVYSK